MNGDRKTYNIAGHPVTVQRYLPLGQVYERSYRVLLFSETSDSNGELNEIDVRTYFDIQYGQTKAFRCSSDGVATLDFEEYVTPCLAVTILSFFLYVVTIRLIERFSLRKYIQLME